MTHTRAISLLQWVGWGMIAVLCVVVGLLWGRMDRQVDKNAADIAVLKAYSDKQDMQMREDALKQQERLERRWGQYLMPTLRQHHDALQSLPLAPEYRQPLPEWLKEQP